MSNPNEENATKLVWSSKNDFKIGNVAFFASVDAAEYHVRESDQNSLLIVKNRDMIECELNATRHLDVKNVVDIGVWQGGSVALLDSVFRPNRIVAIEYSERELPALDSYITAHGRTSNVKLHKGVSQADRDRLMTILDREFGGQRIDLAIDDASHQYEETMISFNVIFPRLVEDGIFVVEDWQWSTMPVHFDSDYFKGRKGLANLILQCMIVCAGRPDIISEVSIFPHSAMIKRGPAKLPNDSFDLASFALNKGQTVPLIL